MLFWNGNGIWTRVSAVSHRDEEGKILGFFTVVADIDALKRAKDRDGSNRALPGLFWSLSLTYLNRRRKAPALI